MSRGKDLVGQLNAHILDIMRGMPECQRVSGRGAGYRLIEEIADLQLGLRGQDGWMTWSLLMSLVQDGKVEVVPGTERRRKYRLT